ncbi:MAG: hypothetical protein QXI12_12020 [Candidatus Methanomethyliaceae archaeon]
MTLTLMEPSTNVRAISASLSNFAQAFDETARLLEKLGQDLTVADTDVYEIVQKSQSNIHAFDQRITDGSVDEVTCREFLSEIHRQINKIDRIVCELPNKFSRESTRARNTVEQLKLDCGVIEARITAVFEENRRLKAENTRMGKQLAVYDNANQKAKKLYGVSAAEIVEVVPGRYEDYSQIPKAINIKIKAFAQKYPCVIGHWATIAYYIRQEVKNKHKPAGKGSRYCNIPKDEIESALQMIQDISVREIIQKHMPNLYRQLDSPRGKAAPAFSGLSESELLASSTMKEFLAWLPGRTRFVPDSLVKSLARVCAQLGISPDKIDLDAVSRSKMTRQVRQAVKKYREFLGR